MSIRKGHSLLITLFVLALVVPASAQWLDTTIYLGDSLYYFSYPAVMISDPINNQVFAAGYNIIAIDAVTYRRTCIPSTYDFSGGFSIMCRNTVNGKIYAAGSTTQDPGFSGSDLFVIDAEADTVVRNVGIKASTMVFDSIHNQLFCIDQWNDNCRLYVVDGVSDSVDAQIALRTWPYDLAYNPTLQKIYCSEANGDRILVVNAATNTLIDSISGPFYYSALTCNPLNNKLYAVSLYSDSLYVLDCATDSIIAVVTVDHFSRSLVYNYVSNKIYCPSDSMLSIIDGLTNIVIATITDTAGFVSLSFCPRWNKLYATHRWCSYITVIDGASNTIDTCIHYEYPPISPTHHENTNSIFCAHEENTGITVVDATTYGLTARFSAFQKFYGFTFNPNDNKLYSVDFFASVLGMDGFTHAVSDTITTGVTMSSVVCNPVVNKLYCGGDEGIIVIDPVADSVTGRIMYLGFPPLPVFCNPATNKVYCSYWMPPFEYLTLVVDCIGDSVLRTLSVPEPRAFCYNPVNNKIYCSHGNGTTNNKVAILDGTTDSLIRDIRDTTLINDVVYDPVNNCVYGVGYRLVTVIDGATDSVTALIRAGHDMNAVTCNPLNNKIYCIDNCMAVDTMYIIDAATNTVIDRCAIGNDPWDLLYNPISNRIYCSNYADHKVTVVDGASNGIVAVIPVGRLPTNLAWDSVHNLVYVLNSSSRSVSVIEDLNAIGEYSLVSPVHPSIHAYPNPCVRQAVFMLEPGPASGTLNLGIYDAAGRLVRELYNSDCSSGSTRVIWDGKDRIGHRVANGVYFARLSADGHSATASVLYIR